MLNLWRRIDRSHTLDDRTHAELVWMAFQSRYGVRWTVVSGDLPMVFLLLTHADAVPSWLVGFVVAASCLRIALAEAYAHCGSRVHPRYVQRRWETAYLVVGTSYALTLALVAAAAISTRDGWIVAWVIGGVTGFAYGIIGYVANRPALAYSMTFAAVAGTVVALVLSDDEFALWLAAALSVAYLAIRSLIERHYAATLRAIADRQAVEQFAQTDHLTGLSNRRHLEAIVDQVLAEGMTGLHWLGIDLDGFKSVNDTFGHAAGDIVLKEAAHRIASVAGTDAFAARVGGDEFVVLLIGDRPGAGTVSERIAARLAEPIPVPQGTARIGASVGATAIRQQDTIDEIAKRADERMYARKAAAKLAA